MKKAMLVLAVFGLVGSLWAADPHVGTWKLNLAKSKFSPPSSAPKSRTLKIETQDNGIKYVSEGIDSEGKAYHEHFTAKYDGKDYPYIGSSTADSLAYTKIDETTLDWVVKKGGKVVSRGRSVVSNGGKTRTVTSKDTDAKGQETTNIAVYQKQ
jgi:hypothetical protein